MSKTSITFVIHQNGQFVRQETLSRTLIRVGRGPGNHLQVEDSAVGKRQAVIEIAGPGALMLVNLGGDSGVAVNGKWVDESPLEVGDRIQLGSSEILLEEVVSEGGEIFGKTHLPSRPFAPAHQAPPTSLMDTRASEAGLLHAEAYTYAMLKGGPAVRSEEVELQHVLAAEVSIAWGANVLFVAHLVPPKNFYVGEEQSPDQPCDFLVPSEKLGAARMPLILAARGDISVVIAPHALGYIEASDGSRVPLATARARATPCAELPGGCQISLPLGSRALVQFGDIVFRVAAVRAGKPMARGLNGLDGSVLAYLALSALSVGGFMSSLAFLVPPLGMLSDDELDLDRLYKMQVYLAATAEREKQPEPGDIEHDTPEAGASGAAPAQGTEGAMGRRDTPEKNRRSAIQGAVDRHEQELPRHVAIEDARTYGMIGLLNSGLLGDPNAPTVPWGADQAIGSDAISAQGDLWSSDPGDAAGNGALGMTGAGESGGGRTNSVGMDGINTIGSAGNGDGDIGLGRGRIPGTHRTQGPRLRVADSSIHGRLPAEVIRRVVRQNHSRFRNCYEQALLQNPGLSGRVSVRFVIGRDGAVTHVANGGSDLPDPKVVTCVTQAFYDIGFPKPESGVVTVTYPILFQSQ